MRNWILGFCAAVLGATLVVESAEAGRLGGARSSGVQRSVTPPSKPSQQQAAPRKQAPAAQPASSGRRWGSILGGLALGGLLGYLFGGSGMLGILVLALLAIGAVLAFRALARRGSSEAPQRMQYAGMNEPTMAAPPPAQSAAQPAE